ncbi:Mannosyltransferase [Salmonella enterica subsp. enterica serovar Wandsworth str. A4-580]|uniref:Mannosyltransferase n=1 Tax=Salmonella enterica subsp. enterica serovar Wandsworth str. A4-580 TaxID=913086 RepID=G5SDR6_SALET|nr:Mannosyltransferase [Salmonella enterica subsp. enterica serovar Wandsworth str. A4-580]
MIVIDGVIFSLQKSGGISVYFSELLRRIRTDKEDVLHLLYNNQNIYTKGSDYVVNRIARLHISVERFIKVNISGTKNDIFDIFHSSYYRKNDIFHSSYYRLPNAKFNGKIITTVHDFTEEIYPRGLISKVHHKQKRQAILGSDGIICISNNTMKDMHKFIPESVNIPTRVIYNGVGDFSVRNIDAKFESYVIFVGARSGYKNFKMCVSALRYFDDIELIVVGGGEFSKEEIKFNLKNYHSMVKKLNFLIVRYLVVMFMLVFFLKKNLIDSIKMLLH